MHKKNTIRIALAGMAVAAALTSSAAAAAPAKTETNCTQANACQIVCEQFCQFESQWKKLCGVLWTDSWQCTPSIDTPETSPELPEASPESPESSPEASPELPETTPDAPETETPSTPETPEQTPQTPSQDTTDTSVSAYEQEVVRLVNEIRAQYGLAELEISETLCDGARLKSQDMKDNNYFSHTSPTYGTPFEMMRSLGISYSSAAENIAMGQSTPQAVVDAWMNSEGHRANILNANFTQIGVGYVANGNYWTQWFIG